MSNPALAFKPEPGTIPDAPGCYLWRDGRGRVVYVGKARSLRARLSNYFQPWNLVPPRTKAMLETARSVEWIVVKSDVEALHLEYNLIKEHRPRYNVRYTDDKSYPYLVVTTSEEVPRARVTRDPRRRDDRRFGPFAHAYAIRETLDLLLRVFPVRSCSQGVYDRAARSGRPCLYYHIGRCAAPCVGHVSVEEHRELVDQLTAFLDGDTEETLARIEAEMREAAAELNFEGAARLRDQLVAARTALEKQQMVSSRREDLDVVALVEDDLEAAVQAFFVRRGRVVGRKGWTVDKVEAISTGGLLTSFLLELYEERADDVPPLVLVPEEPEDAAALSELLEELRGRRVTFRVPRRGEKRTLFETVRDNARESFQRHKLRRAQDLNARSQALRELQLALGLDEAPLRIECFDVSHLGGTEVVGSMVVFEDGLPKRSDYRRFKVRADRNDDYAAMHEVVRRRFLRYVEEQSGPVAADDGDGRQRRFAYPPNLVLIDGGRGQLRAARAAMDALGVEGVDVAALAKRYEELHVADRPGPVVLPRGSDALFLVQRIRDEAHRSAVTYQRIRRRRSVRETVLDDVPGVGPARRKALLRHFGSVKRLRLASVEELMEVPGVSRTIAAAVHAHLHGEEATA